MKLLSGKYFPIGLDISDFSIKAVQLVKYGKKIDIQALAFTEVQPGLIEDGAIINGDVVSAMIKKLLSKPRFGRFMSRDAAACLPENKSFIKLIEIEKTPNKLEDLIGVEIQKHIPYALDEIYYDWQKIQESESIKAVIAAAPRNIINQYTDLLEKSNLSVSALEIEAVAICRSLLKEEAPKWAADAHNTSIIIDIGARRSSIIFYSNQSILFTISNPISGQAVTDTIADNLEIDKEQAEKAKIICGLDENIAQGVIKKVLMYTVSLLMQKIIEAIKYYEIHYPDSGPISRIILTGGGANIKDLDKILNSQLNLAINIGDPVNKIINDGKAKSNFSETHKLSDSILIKKRSSQPIALTQDNTNAFTTAIGLALRGIYEEYL